MTVVGRREDDGGGEAARVAGRVWNEGGGGRMAAEGEGKICRVGG